MRSSSTPTCWPARSWRRARPGWPRSSIAFGPDMLTDDGGWTGRRMGRRVFGDDDARQRLEAIIHPGCGPGRAEIEAAAGEDAIVVHDIPLLVETGQADALRRGGRGRRSDGGAGGAAGRAAGDDARTRPRRRIAAQARRESGLQPPTTSSVNNGSSAAASRCRSGLGGPVHALTRRSVLDVIDSCQAARSGSASLRSWPAPPARAGAPARPRRRAGRRCRRASPGDRR